MFFSVLNNVFSDNTAEELYARQPDGLFVFWIQERQFALTYWILQAGSGAVCPIWQYVPKTIYICVPAWTQLQQWRAESSKTWTYSVFKTGWYSGKFVPDSSSFTEPNQILNYKIHLSNLATI